MLTINLIKEVSSRAVKKRDVNRINKLFNRFFSLNFKLNINLIIVSNKKIKNINKKYRKKNKITDVLSFCYDKQNGEIFIAYEKAREQAKEFKKSINSEINKLLVHGLLHVIGFDHEKGNKKALQMESWEDKILNYVN